MIIIIVFTSNHCQINFYVDLITMNFRRFHFRMMEPQCSHFKIDAKKNNEKNKTERLMLKYFTYLR